MIRGIRWHAGYRHRIRTGHLGSTEALDSDELNKHTENAGYYLQCSTSKGSWKDLYFFQLQQCTEKDFAMYNWFCATCSDAPMMNMKIAAVQTDHGRITYNGKNVTVLESTKDVHDKQRETVQIASQNELDEQLMMRFGIKIV